MPQIKSDCPHCKALGAAFNLWLPLQTRPGSGNYITLGQCGVCYEGIVIKLRGGLVPAYLDGRIPLGIDCEIVDRYPQLAATDAPNHVPNNVSSFYRQGMNCLQRGDVDAAGTMFRKALDTALKILHPTGSGTLFKRIESLPPEVGATKAMIAWAHNIRELGNDAAHEEELFTEAQAKAIQKFTEMFLTYAFTMPELVKANSTIPQSE